jgi:TRAP transporter TAXI family solute receptor
MRAKDKAYITQRRFFKIAGLMVLILLMAGIPKTLLRSAEAAEVRNIELRTSTMGGVWYPIGCAMANIINKNVPNVNCSTVTSPGMSIENVNRIHNREGELAFSVPASMYAGYHGRKPFEHKMDILGWFSAYRGIYLMAALQKTGIKRVADLRGKKVGTGTPGSFTNRFVENVLLPAHGLNPGDYKAERLTWPEMMSAMMDGHIDAFLGSMSKGNALMQELSMSRKLNWLTVEKEAAQTIMKKDPYFYAGDLVGEYGIKKPVIQMMYRFQLMCGSYLEERLIYDLTKAIFTHLEQLHDVAVVTKDITIPAGFEGMSIPPHPGSAKFFAEHGVYWKDPLKK